MDIEVFEYALDFKKMPYEIREQLRHSSRDIEWLWVVAKARELAAPEIRRRMG